MENIQMNYFGNDNYKILKILSDNQVEVLGDIIIPITQQDIADLAQFSKVKTNQIINDLINKGLADTYQGKRGKYILTKLGKKAIEIMEGELSE